MNERFENVNLLRAFAAVAVVAYHVIQYAHWTDFPLSGPLVTFRIGWIGVDLFYVISGFVITRSALALWRREPATFVPRYWARRLTRIVRSASSPARSGSCCSSRTFSRRRRRTGSGRSPRTSRSRTRSGR
jgi:hypothetical protein